MDLMRPLLRPGMHILDVGAGRHSTIPHADRPAGCVYVGLDEVADESSGRSRSTTRRWSVTSPSSIPPWPGAFDLIVSWQVFEHVPQPARAYENIRRYLKPGGDFVARMTARYALFAIANRMMPFGVARRLGARLSRRPVDTVFRAFYRDSSFSDIARIFGEWGSWELRVEYGGHSYFDFSAPSRWAYRQYVRFAQRHPGRAPHYTVIARTPASPGTTTDAA